MAWTDPKTNWDENYEPSPEDLNRIEANTHALKSEAIDIDGEKTFTEKATFEDDVNIDGDAEVGGDLTVVARIDTGQGLTNLHLMNQNVRSTDAVTFSTVNTGHGNNNLHPMNQGVRTTDNVTHANLTLSGAMNPRTNPSGSSQGLTPPNSWVVPRGLYTMVVTGDPGVAVFLDVNVAGSWRTSDKAFIGGAIVSDGSNVRLRATGSAGAAIYYLKF